MFLTGMTSAGCQHENAPKDSREYKKKKLILNAEVKDTAPLDWDNKGSNTHYLKHLKHHYPRGHSKRNLASSVSPWIRRLRFFLPRCPSVPTTERHEKDTSLFSVPGVPVQRQFLSKLGTAMGR